MSEKAEWEPVDEELGSDGVPLRSTARMSVPGGALYRVLVHTPEAFAVDMVALAFVPEIARKRAAGTAGNRETDDE